MRDAVVILSAVELEKAVTFPMGNIVELRQLFTETFGESLAWKLGQVIESFEPPELEDRGVGEREGLGESEIGELEGEWIGLA